MYMHRITKKYTASQLLTREFDATDQKDSQSFLNYDLTHSQLQLMILQKYYTL